MSELRGRIVVPLLLAVFGLVGVAMAVGGVVVYHRATTGRVTDVKVSDCHFLSTGRREFCTGAWVVGGSLLDKGHVVIGHIEGATSDDLGHTLKVRIHGGTAYVRSIRLPIILFVFGVFIAAVLLFNAWKVFATSAPGRRREEAPSGERPDPNLRPAD
jgi:hypothetical protein